MGTAARPRTAASFSPVGGDTMAALLDWNATEGLSKSVSSHGTGAGANLPDIRSSRERVSSRAIVVGLPFGVTLELLPTHLPLPAKIRTELLEPIQLDPDPERANDERYVEPAYQDVERRIQQGVDRLAAKRLFPVFG